MANIRIALPRLAHQQGRHRELVLAAEQDACRCRVAAVALGKNREEAMRAAETRNREVARWKAGGAAGPAFGARDPPPPPGRHRSARWSPATAAKCSAGASLMDPRSSVQDVRDLRDEPCPARDVGRRQADCVDHAGPGARLARREATAEAAGGIGHAAAFNLLKQLRQVLAFAEAVDIIPKGSNPAAAFGLGKPPPRRGVWTIEDEAAFDAAAARARLSVDDPRALARALRRPAPGGLDRLYRAPAGRRSISSSRFCMIAWPTMPGRVWGWSLAQGKTSRRAGRSPPRNPARAGHSRVRARRARRTTARATAPRCRRACRPYRPDRRAHRPPWKQSEFIRTWRQIVDHAADRPRPGAHGPARLA